MPHTIKVLAVLLVGFFFAFHLPQIAHGEDLGDGPFIVKKLVTPFTNIELFRSIKKCCAFEHIENGTVWGRDHSSHGGKQYKV